MLQEKSPQGQGPKGLNFLNPARAAAGLDVSRRLNPEAAICALMQLALAKQPLIPPASLTNGFMGSAPASGAGGGAPRPPPGSTKAAAANGIYMQVSPKPWPLADCLLGRVSCGYQRCYKSWQIPSLGRVPAKESVPTCQNFASSARFAIRI